MMARMSRVSDRTAANPGNGTVATYYFHLCDGFDTLIDPEGREISDISLIAGMALKEARAIIGQDVVGGAIKLGQHIEVLDEGGAIIHRLEFRDAVTIRK
jgi:hypothetical protein